MVSVKESLGSIVIDTERIIQESQERIRQALELESSQLREKVERESNQIIADAKEEAENIVVQARQEAEQIVKESHEESAQVIQETRKKIRDLILDMASIGSTMSESVITQDASETGTRLSQLIVLVNQGIQEIIGETEKRIKTELEQLLNAIPEVETKSPPLREMISNEDNVNSQPTDKTEATPTSTVNNKMDLETPIVKVISGALKAESSEARLFQGCHTIEIISPFDQAHPGGLPEALTQSYRLKIISKDSYARGNRYVTKYTIDLEEPNPLLKILSAMPQVKDVSEYKENIVVTLK